MATIFKKSIFKASAMKKGKVAIFANQGISD